MKSFVVFIILFYSMGVFAQEVTVFDIRRPLALSDKEKPQKDYYINAGSEKGLKENTVVTITRRRALYDAYQNKSPGDLLIPVGKLRIIHSQKGLSVARIQSIYSRNKIPGLDYNAIMVGDKVDLSTISRAEKVASHNPVQKINPFKMPVVDLNDAPIYGPFQAFDFASSTSMSESGEKITATPQ